MHFWAPQGGSPPGGQKSAHFFGYLITLPVGTVWSPPRGHFRWDRAPYHLRWAVFIHPRSGYGWTGALGRRASDGYPLAGLTANGWYVPSGRAPPSRQGRKSAQDREVMGRRRPFARAKRGPTTGVTGKVRKCLAEQAMPCQVCRGYPPELSVRTSASGHGQGERSGPWPWDTSPQAIDAPPPRLSSLQRPPTNNY